MLRLDIRQIIAFYTGRWNIEATFGEVGCSLYLETARGWCRAMVLRLTLCLFGLYAVVAWLYQTLPLDRRVGAITWPGKAGVAFSDALAAVCRWIWSDGVFAQTQDGLTIEKRPPPVHAVLYAALAPAA